MQKSTHPLSEKVGTNENKRRHKRRKSKINRHLNRNNLYADPYLWFNYDYCLEEPTNFLNASLGTIL